MRVDVEMINSFGVKGRSPPLHPVNDITLFQKELGKVAAILACDAGDEGRFSS